MLSLSYSYFLPIAILIFIGGCATIQRFSLWLFTNSFFLQSAFMTTFPRISYLLSHLLTTNFHHPFLLFFFFTLNILSLSPFFFPFSGNKTKLLGFIYKFSFFYFSILSKTLGHWLLLHFYCSSSFTSNVARKQLIAMI